MFETYFLPGILVSVLDTTFLTNTLDGQGLGPGFVAAAGKTSKAQNPTYNLTLLGVFVEAEHGSWHSVSSQVL